LSRVKIKYFGDYPLLAPIDPNFNK